jgi:hypothetical protein
VLQVRVHSKSSPINDNADLAGSPCAGRMTGAVFLMGEAG